MLTLANTRTKAKFLKMVSAVGLVAGMTAASSCGRVNAPQDQNSQLDGVALTEAYDSVDWYFPCPFDGPNDPDRLIVPQQTNPRKLILNGIGPFEFFKEYFVHPPMTIHGRVCPWKLVHRDVTFVIDVSGSMSDTDPQLHENPTDSNSPMSCGRLKALEALLAKMPPNITRFAVATYDDGIHEFSSHFFDNKAGLYADLLRSAGANAKIIDVICRADGGTEYTVGLSKAKEILLTGDPAATKEVLFLSDGQPGDQENTILNMTNDFKTSGIIIGGRRQTISIATILLGDAPASDILEKMASVDNSVIPPKPIFAKAADADQLADILGKMIDNNKLQGSRIVHAGDAPNTPQNTIDVFTTLDAHNQFVTQPFSAKIDRGQKNYTIGFEYWDTMQNRSTYPGTLHWKQ